MGSVGTPVVLRIVEVAHGQAGRTELLASVGLPADATPAGWAGESVDETAYYALLERAAGADDHALPMRYGDALRADDMGALGLAMKTAATVGDALRRLVRYVRVLSDTLEYESIGQPWGQTFALTGRPPLRRGAALANECALAAVVSVIRQIVGGDFAPRAVSFRHAAPPAVRAHRDYFRCPVSFDAPIDGVELTARQLATPTLLGDEGLSAFLLAQLDRLEVHTAERSLVGAVQAAVADALPDGQPARSQVARRLGMSERTLQRRLTEHGETFQALVARARRDAAEALLRAGRHNLADIAFLTGFADQTAFTRAFRRWTGKTPAAFRAGSV